MPSLAIVEGVTDRTESAPLPLVLWSQSSNSVRLKVSLSSLELERTAGSGSGAGEARHYVRITKRSVKMQFVATEPSAREGKGRENCSEPEVGYVYADFPILWTKEVVIPQLASLVKMASTITLTIPKLNRSEDGEGHPFAVSIQNIEQVPRYYCSTYIQYIQCTMYYYTTVFHVSAEVESSSMVLIHSLPFQVFVAAPQLRFRT